jgi:ferritin-like metal-binding protein YciE
MIFLSTIKTIVMKMNSLSNLLAHEIVDLYSAEEQIIEALPKMIEKAQNQELKKALKEHLKVTEQQKKRLEKVHKLIKQEDGSSEEELGDTECKGMKGLIEEGKKAMEEEMEPDVMDAAIIASAQKIEHYEISGYGTARAFAREVGMSEVEKLLQQTLDEEYLADDLLTELAVGQVNDEAEEEEGEEEINVRKLPAGSKSNSRNKSSNASRSTAKRSSGTRASSNGKSSGKSSGSSRSTSRTKKSASAGGRSKSTTSKGKSSGSSSSRGKSSRSR